MLVLSRQRDETVLIGDNIELTVVDIRGDKVRIGIKAPADVAVHRKEVCEAIRKENEEASQLADKELKGLAPPRTRCSRKRQAVVSAGTPVLAAGS